MPNAQNKQSKIKTGSKKDIGLWIIVPDNFRMRRTFVRLIKLKTCSAQNNTNTPPKLNA